MKEFIKDYVELYKQSGAFYKKHWKGVVVLNAVLIAAEFAWLGRGEIKRQIEEKFHKEEDEGLE